MDEARLNPDALLASLRRQEVQAKRGKLKVFFGMAPGVGKSYAMLEAARRAHADGCDVVIGYVESHGRRETEALVEGLPIVPRRSTEYRGMVLLEMDLDAVLLRRPQLALVDEFAHTNAPGSRHPKRYQDVMELLEAGVDVFTTLNVQHLESRAEAVREITGACIRETVPDTALDNREIEMVDLTPEELRARLAAGKVYLPEHVRAAQDHFFRAGNLAALRELALRYAAEQVGQDVLAYRQRYHVADPWKSGQRLLVAVSPSPTSASLVRWTRRLAGEFQAPWMAVYVELPRPLADEEKARLTQHLALARELGAEVITTSDDDVVRGILRTAREQNATQLVVGKPFGWRVIELLRGGSLLNRLIRESGHIDIHAVRAEGEPTPFLRTAAPRFDRPDVNGYAIAFGVVAGVTGLNALLQRELGYQSLALIYLLSVVVLAMFVGRGPTLAAATLTALLWNFLFVPPLFTLRITGATDAMLFFTYFAVALAMGHLAARLRAQQKAERQREERATALYLLTRELGTASDFANLLAIVVREVGRSFRADVGLSLQEESSSELLAPYFAGTWSLNEKEQSVALWAFVHRQAAGQGTATLPASEGLHLPLLAGERAAGVLSLRFHERAPLAPHQRDFLDTCVRQIALVLDRQRLRDTEQRARLLAESERLSKTLLDSVSHEMRTPLTVIASAASSLKATGRDGTLEFHQSMVGEILEATNRLNRLVGNLLDMTRLEAGYVKARLDWCDVSDLVQVTLREVENDLSRHQVTVDTDPGLPLVWMDFVLMQQALTNLLLNAATHTPPDTVIHLKVTMDDKALVIAVADTGPGLTQETLGRVFDKFYRSPSARSGGTGLGLSIVRGFMEAQGGRAEAANLPEKGAVFKLRLPLRELPPFMPKGNP